MGPSVGLVADGWMVIVGLVTAAFLMWVSIPTREPALLALGTVGLFAYVTWAVVRYFGETLGVPVALVLVGVVFLTLAVLAGRLGALSRAGGGRGRLTAH